MKIKHIGEEYLKFDDGSMLRSVHFQDCCEWHWLDFSVMAHYNIGTSDGMPINIYNQEFDFTDGVTFYKVKDVGIVLMDSKRNKFLVCGYGNNNGYYGTDILLQYTDAEGNVVYEYDVSECQELDDGWRV